MAKIYYDKDADLKHLKGILKAASAAATDESEEAIIAAAEQMAKEVHAAGFGVTPSHGNFILVETGARTPEADAHLKSRGVIVRRMESYGLPGHLRVSVGDEEGCRAVAHALRDFGRDSGAGS